MANVLTDLAADIYKAADVVSRELTGIIPSVLINADGSERVAKGDTVRSHFTRQATAVDSTPAMTIPEGTDQTVDNKTATISKSRAVQIPWTGEDIKHVNNGSGFETIYGDQIAQAMRTLTNEMEADLWAEAYTNASRAIGTAGTTPFGSNFDLLADARKILVDNGAPINDRQSTLVLNTAAGANLRKLAQLQKANEAGNDILLRQGELLDLQGLMLKESAGVGLHTAGTGSGYLVNDASLAVGDTVIAADTGTGTILAGDVVTFDSDSDNSYVVTEALSGGSFTIGGPGLRVAIPENDPITVVGNATKNIAFHRNAIELIARPEAQPQGGDAAVDAMMVQDPRSGLPFELRVYKGYKKAMFEVGLAWGTKAWLDKFIVQVNG